MENVIFTSNRIDRTRAATGPYIKDIESGLFPGHVGFRIGGHSAGPNVVIAGGTKLTGEVYQRLLLLPSLSRLRGTLFLLELDRLNRDGRIDDVLPKGIFVDGQMFLPFVAIDQVAPDMREAAVKQAYWSVLQLCARLGMIAGRGLPFPGRATAPSHKADVVALATSTVH